MLFFLTYIDCNSTFLELFDKDKSVSVHKRNVKEPFCPNKIKNNLSLETVREICHTYLKF